MSTIESIDLHVRSYRSALKSTLEITINSLTNSHLKMDSILHPAGNDPKTLDTSALIYALLRLPDQIDNSEKVIVGQNPEVFAQSGFTSILSWPITKAPGRRRICHFSADKKTLAVFVASISDIDDLVNLLIAYQSEWNKFHLLLRERYHSELDFTRALKTDSLPSDFSISPTDWKSLLVALGPNSSHRLTSIYQHVQNLRIRQLAGSWVDFAKNTQKWWGNICSVVEKKFDITHRDLYFVSSNAHSFVNLFSGFALQHQSDIISFIKSNHPDLYPVWEQIQKKEIFLHPNDFLYYCSQFYLSIKANRIQFDRYLQSLDIIDIPGSHYLDINTQVFPIKNLVKSRYLDPRLRITKPKKIAQSDAYLLNVDYPLGFTAYNVLNTILENVNNLRGIYILGKSAILNSEIGDIQIPRAVFDEHTQNTYMFKNCFSTFFPFPNNQGSVLTNQKAVSVLGTFLENEALLEKYSQNNLTVIEMESGPYLGAVTEATYNQQTPQNTIVDLNSAPFDIGIINYTSDTPYSKAKNLGAGSLELRGAEPVYLGSLTILQRIIDLEESLSD